MHNTHIINDYAVTSWYKDGFAIIDVSRPANMVQVGRYDTYPGGSGSGFEGCWGVYPYLPSGTIVASTIRASGTSNGELWVLTPDYIRGCYLEGLVTDAANSQPLPGVKVELVNTSTNETTSPYGLYKMGVVLSGTYSVKFSKTGYLPQTLSASLSNGVLTTLNVALVPSSLLPVELIRFDAVREGRDALLQWETASETGNAGFEVQHSANGGRDWVVAGFVPAQGRAATYSFRVAQLPPGGHIFRLRQTDLDGSAAFSPWRTLQIPAAGLELEIWPNPVRGQATLHIRTPRPGPVALRLQAAGLPLDGLHWQLDVADETSVPIDLSGLPAGLYYLLVQDGAEVARRVVSVLR